MMLAYTEADPIKVVPLSGRDHILRMAREGGLGADAMLQAIMKKSDAETAFSIPMQGYYESTLSGEPLQAWKTQREAGP